MLRAVASAGAQVRESAALAAEADLSRARPTRAGRAPSWSPASAPPAVTGDILATVAGPRCPVPIIGHRSAGVPGWVGAADVVIAVSRRGRSPEALAAAEAAARRGARLVAIGAPGLASCRRWPSGARAPFIPVPRRGPGPGQPVGR